MKALGAFEALATIAALAVVAFLAYKIFGLGKSVGNAINTSVNSGVKTLTGGAAKGGEDTVGGVVARAREFLSGDSKAIDAMKAGAPAIRRIKLGDAPTIPDFPTTQDFPEPDYNAGLGA